MNRRRKTLEPGFAKDAGMGAGGMQQQLRLDAIDLRRVEQRLEEMPEQGLFDFVRGESEPNWEPEAGLRPVAQRRRR